MKKFTKALLSTLAMGFFFGFLWFIVQPGREKYLIAFFVILMVVITLGLFYLMFSSEAPDRTNSKGRPKR